MNASFLEQLFSQTSDKIFTDIKPDIIITANHK